MPSYLLNDLKTNDPSLREIVHNDHARCEQHIERIATEQYASPAMMQAKGSRLIKKYADGYAGRRYYGGW